jgi:hypothetical protein
MLFSKCYRAALLSLAALHTAALSIAGKPNLMIKPYKRNEPLQDVVTWDEVCYLMLLCSAAPHSTDITSNPFSSKP